MSYIQDSGGRWPCILVLSCNQLEYWNFIGRNFTALLITPSLSLVWSGYQGGVYLRGRQWLRKDPLFGVPDKGWLEKWGIQTECNSSLPCQLLRRMPWTGYVNLRDIVLGMSLGLHKKALFIPNIMSWQNKPQNVKKDCGWNDIFDWHRTIVAMKCQQKKISVELAIPKLAPFLPHHKISVGAAATNDVRESAYIPEVHYNRIPFYVNPLNWPKTTLWPFRL